MAERLKRALNLRGLTPADLVAQNVLSKAGVYFILDGTTKADTIRSSTVDNGVALYQSKCPSGATLIIECRSESCNARN